MAYIMVNNIVDNILFLPHKMVNNNQDNMKLICAQYTTVRKSMFNACGACGFGLFIPHYKVPDLTGDVEFGGEDPAFADNVIVVEGCFLRISIEGLKV